MGRLGADVDGMGAHTTTSAAWSRPGRNSACPAGFSSPTLPCSLSAKCRATHSSPGAGGSPSRSASSSSASASASGLASWRRRSSPSSSPSARSSARRSSKSSSSIRRRSCCRRSRGWPNRRRSISSPLSSSPTASGRCTCRAICCSPAVLAASVLSFVSIPLCGHVSDRIGRKNMYMIGAVATGDFRLRLFRHAQHRLGADRSSSRSFSR